MSSSASDHPSRRLLLGGLAALPTLPMLAAGAQAQTAAAPQPTSGGFSFAAVGDTRPMMYLPENAGEPDLVKLFLKIFGLVMPERVAEEVVKRDVKMTSIPTPRN